MNFDMKHAPGVGSIAGPVDQQSSALPLCYGCPHSVLENWVNDNVIRVSGIEIIVVL